MIRSSVIFSDEDKEPPKRPVKRARDKPDKVSLSRDDYRHNIETAYQEGKKDALEEKDKQKQKKKASQDNDNDKEKQRKDVQQKGIEEAIKEHAKEEEQNRQRFESISDRHDIELLRANSVFPFTFFTDTLIIDTTKITITKRQLFATEYVTTIPLKDLSDVNVQTYLFLGTIMLQYMPQTDSPGTTPPVKTRITNLAREDAIKAKNILKGALVAKAEEINIAVLPPEEIEKVLHKFGASEGVI
jgi:hypothetical protein